MGTMYGMRGLVFLLFVTLGWGIEQNQHLIVTSFKSTTPLEKLGRFSTQLERPYRAQAGYDTRTLSTEIGAANTYVDMAVWSDATTAAAGLAASAMDPAVSAFDALVSDVTIKTYNAIRAWQAMEPVIGTYSRFTAFNLTNGVTDQMFISGTVTLEALYSKRPGYVGLSLLKTTSQTWALVSSWTNQTTYADAMLNTTATTAPFWLLVKAGTEVAVDLSQTIAFDVSFGTPSSFVVFDSFYLKQGQTVPGFLASSAEAEAPLRGQTGYLGRNLMMAASGEFVIEWWWASKDDYLTSLAGLSNFDFALMVNTSTQTASFASTKASFFPWYWNKEIQCGAPIFFESFQLNSTSNVSEFLSTLQTLDSIRRTVGFNAGYTLQDEESTLLINMGPMYSDYANYVNEYNQLQNTPEMMAYMNTQNLTSKSFSVFYHVKGFWPWADISYSCHQSFTVDPALTGMKWSDGVLRRPDPEHLIVLPPPGIAYNGKLLVFLPEYGMIPSDYSEYLHEAASQGYLAVGLAYLNGIEVLRLCIGESKCFQKSWLAYLYGATDDSPRVVSDIDAVNSVTGRTLALLQYLSTEPAYAHVPAAQYFGPGGLNMANISWGGSGIGGSIVFALAQDQEIDRAVAYDGPVDESLTGNVWLSEPSATPKDKWYIASAQPGGKCATIKRNALMAGVPTNNIICSTTLTDVTADSSVLANWAQFYTIQEVWAYGLSQCASTGLSTSVITTLSGGMPHLCAGSGMVYQLQTSSPYFHVGTCQNCNVLDDTLIMSVSSFGYDRGTCTEANPCRTIAYTISQSVPGARIMIQRGTYDENVVIPVDKTDLTMVGAVDSDGDPESILRCGRQATADENYCIVVHAPGVTLSGLVVEHTEGLPTNREVGVLFMSTAVRGVMQKSVLSRAGVTEVAYGGSRCVEVLGATDVGIFDNKFKGTYQNCISFVGSRSAALRNLIWGSRTYMSVGVMLARATTGLSENNTVANNKIRGVNGDGVVVQSDMNLVSGNKIWRNFGHPVRVCSNTSCTGYSGPCAMNNIISENKLGWNQAGWIQNDGCETTLTCHPKQSVNISASCTPKIMMVNTAQGSDLDCTYNDPTRKCKTIAGAIARSEARYWVVTEDPSYTEAPVIPHEGMVLRGNDLGTRTVIKAPSNLNGSIVTSNASDVSLEALYVLHSDAAPTSEEIGIHVTPMGQGTNIEDCQVVRTATSSTPASMGVVVDAPDATVYENVFGGLYQDQLVLTSTKADVWLNVIEMAGQIGILLKQLASGAYTTTNGTRITENIIKGAGLDGIQIQGDGALVQDNEVSGAGRVGIHLCTYNNETGPGGACNWTAIPSLVYPDGNIVKDNRAIRSPINFIDDMNNTMLNDFTMQLPVYENIGILDPIETLTSQWVTVAPSKAVIGGVVPLKVFGFWNRGHTLKAKLAAGRDDCYGFAPIVPGGKMETSIDEYYNFGNVGPVSQAGEYRVCIMNRQDWELTENIVTIQDTNANMVFYGAPSCQGAIEAEGSGYCGCYFNRGSPVSPYLLSKELPLTTITAGGGDIAVNHGCCSLNTPIRTTNVLNADTTWGMCKR